MDSEDFEEIILTLERIFPLTVQKYINLDLLPTDIILLIMTEVFESDTRNIQNICLINKSFNALCHNESFLIKLHHNLFPVRLFDNIYDEFEYIYEFENATGIKPYTIATLSIPKEELNDVVIFEYFIYFIKSVTFDDDGTIYSYEFERHEIFNEEVLNYYDNLMENLTQNRRRRRKYILNNNEEFYVINEKQLLLLNKFHFLNEHKRTIYYIPDNMIITKKSPEHADNYCTYIYKEYEQKEYICTKRNYSLFILTIMLEPLLTGVEPYYFF